MVGYTTKNPAVVIEWMQPDEAAVAAHAAIVVGSSSNCYERSVRI